jgi:hypothetical protein
MNTRPDFPHRAADINDLIERVARRSARAAGIEHSDRVARIVRQVAEDTPDALGAEMGGLEAAVRTRAWIPVLNYAQSQSVGRPRCQRAVARTSTLLVAAAVDPAGLG